MVPYFFKKILAGDINSLNLLVYYAIILNKGRVMRKPVLAHVSRRLINDLIGYSWSGVRPSKMLKDLLLQNRLANHSQILGGASLGRGNESLFAASGSHDQDGRHAHIW